FSGLAGISGNGSGFTAANPAAPEGAQVAFLQITGSFSQTVTGWQAATYQISFSAAQRAGYPAEDFRVLVDGQAWGTFTPSGTSYAGYSTASFTVTAGSHTVAFQGVDSGGGDRTAFVDNVSITAATPPQSGLSDAGFEAPAVGAGQFAYDPAGAPWAF